MRRPRLVRASARPVRPQRLRERRRAPLLLLGRLRVAPLFVVGGLVLASVAATSTGCADRSAPLPTAAPAVLGSSVARVSAAGHPPIEVPGPLVAEVARAQGISLAEARDRVVSDVVFELAARDAGLDRSRSRDVDAVLAQRMALELLATAKAQGPVTDAELDAVVDKHWWDVRRPESFMAVHALVGLKPDADAATEKKAQALAETFREVALSVGKDAKDTPPPPQPASERVMLDSVTLNLKRALRDVPLGGQMTVVEQLPPIAKDGKSVLPGERDPFDPQFVSALVALSARGDVSPIVRSPFGLHVIVLVARYPAVDVPADELGRRFLPEVYDVRARKIADALLAQLHAGTVVEIEKNADALLAQVKVEPTGVTVASLPGARPADGAPSPPPEKSPDHAPSGSGDAP